MNRWKRLFYYLLINVAVSACTVAGVLLLWDRYYRPPERFDPAALIVTATPVRDADPAITASATLAPSGTAQPEFESYQIQSGDTLSGIASRFGVSMDDILAVNELDDPDNLTVGEVLLIPLEPIPTPSPIHTATAPPPASPRAPSPQPSSSPMPAGAQIPIEIVTVVGAGALEDERVVIRYRGEGELSLANWQLESEAGQVYIFPQLTLFEDGAVTVFTKTGSDSVIELYWGRTESVWREGDTVTLRDPNGDPQATYRIP